MSFLLQLPGLCLKEIARSCFYFQTKYIYVTPRPIQPSLPKSDAVFHPNVKKKFPIKIPSHHLQSLISNILKKSKLKKSQAWETYENSYPCTLFQKSVPAGFRGENEANCVYMLVHTHSGTLSRWMVRTQLKSSRPKQNKPMQFKSNLAKI